MIVRYLPVILVLAALVLALAPIETAAQTELGPGVRTEMTPLDREAHNGVFDRKPRRKPATVTAGDVSPAQAEGGRRVQRPDVPRPKSAGAPVNAGADRKAAPPGADPRQVRPAQAFPPERIQTPQSPSRGGVQTPDPAAGSPALQDDPRSVEEQPDPGG
jgi:hypothetical protein